MSELSLGTLSGLAANSFVVDVAAGSTLDLSAGAVFPAGSIIQVVSTTKTDTYTASVAARPTIGGAVTGLTASITPSSTSSKILISVSAFVSTDSANNGIFVHLFKDGSVSGFAGDAAGSRQRAANIDVNNNRVQAISSIVFLDSPATVSSVTYDIRLSHDSGSAQNVYVNRSEADTDDNLHGRGASSITLMEVAG